MFGRQKQGTLALWWIKTGVYQNKGFILGLDVWFGFFV